MESVLKEVGNDVSKLYLDISVGGEKPFRVSNTVEGIAQMLGRTGTNIRVFLESSGGYERLSCRELRRHGVEVRILSPYRVRKAAQANGPKAKTDKIDAKWLAKVGPTMEFWRHPRTQAEEEALDLSRTIETLKTHAARLRNTKSKMLMDPVAAAALERGAQSLDKEAKALQKEFEERIKGTKMGDWFELALTVPYVGVNLARQCVCEFPDDIRNRKHGQLTGYVGLAPIDDSSGQRTNHSGIARGCSRLKKALYMPALSCIGNQQWAIDAYTKLRAMGKSFRTAIVAIMRRLLIRIIAVIKRGSPWQVEPTRT